MSKHTYSPCPSCGAVNRVDLERASSERPVCSRCRSPLALHGAVSEVDGAGLDALVQSSTLPVVVDFWAAWCGPCKLFAPSFAKVAEELAGRFVFAKLDTENDPGASIRNQVQAIPTLVVFECGRETMRRSGSMPPGLLREWLLGAAA